MTTPVPDGADRSRLDVVFVLAAAVSASLLAFLLLRESLESGLTRLWLYVLFWLVLAYIALPRAHRVLTSAYVPGYFVGRTRTSDGLLGDPVNLALMGAAGQVHDAFASARWTRADELTPRSSGRIVAATLTRRSYPEAPVSPLQLFDRTQDVAYQQEVQGNPARRHHVRLWRCPDGWQLPGGRPVDWLGAATYDRAVGLSLFTLQVTHKISPRIDAERDHVVQSLADAVPAASVSVYERFSVAYRNRNGGGDLVETDGDLPIVDLRASPSGPAGVEDEPPSPSVHRPPSLVVGGVLLILRAAAELVTLVPGSGLGTLPGGGDPPVPLVLSAATVTAVVGVLVLAGLEPARVAGLTVALVGVVASTWVHFATGLDSDLRSDLVGLSLDILVLVALTSPAAAAWTRHRNRRRSRGRT